MRKTISGRFAAALMFSLLAVLVSQESVLAIPAFARKYNMTCKTCHYPIPRLKEYGNEFAGNGFQLADQEAPRYYSDTGDDKLSLIRDFPIAIRMDAFVQYRDLNNGKDGQTDLETPYLIKLVSGGALTENIAYYFYFYMDERGEVAGVEDAYIMFNNLFGADFDIYLGQFQISDPLFKRELRLTLEDYNAYTTKVGNSHKSLKYDRGMMVTLGLDTGTSFVFELLNGNGLATADADHTFDDNKNKDVMGRISQDIGDYFRLGVFGYWGRERQNGYKNDTWFMGPDFTFNYKEYFELNCQYVKRNDDNPLFFTSTDGVDDTETDALMVEAIIAPKGDESDYYFVGLYNWVDSDFDILDRQSLTGHMSYILRRNIRLTFEYSHEFELETDKVGMGFVTAF